MIESSVHLGTGNRDTQKITARLEPKIRLRFGLPTCTRFTLTK